MRHTFLSWQQYVVCLSGFLFKRSLYGIWLTLKAVWCRLCPDCVCTNWKVPKSFIVDLSAPRSRWDQPPWIYSKGQMCLPLALEGLHCKNAGLVSESVFRRPTCRQCLVQWSFCTSVSRRGGQMFWPVGWVGLRGKNAARREAEKHFSLGRPEATMANNAVSRTHFTFLSPHLCM